MGLVSRVHLVPMNMYAKFQLNTLDSGEVIQLRKNFNLVATQNLAVF